MGLAILGPVTVDGPAGALSPRDRVVLAALAVQPGNVVDADQLAEALWGDSRPASANKVLHGCVMRIRRALGAGAVETLPHGYRLTLPPHEIDAQRFERLLERARELLVLGEADRAGHLVGEALAMWHGRALAELECWEPGRIEAERLGELRRDAEELHIEAALRAGRHRDVLAEARARVAEAPLRERRWVLLALAQYQAGRQGDALRTFSQARRTLATELGLDPGPDLVAMEQAILCQDPSLVVEAPLAEPSATCPYLGLVPYGVDDGEAFFGRDGEAAACLRSLATHGVLTVVGPSGSGKSSLVRAGIAAGLRRAGRAVVVVSPGARPLHALTRVPQKGEAPVLIVDQLEEAITACEDVGERTAFFTALIAHAQRAPLVVAMRADRLGELSSHPGFAHLAARNLHLLSAMAEDDLRAAIEGPARQAGLLLEPGLVDLLVREVEGEPGALPLLSHALRETWERREGRTLTVAGYRASGGIRGAVAQSAEEVYARVPGGQRPALRDLLLRLVTPTLAGEPVRSRVPRRMVATDPEHERLIEDLVAARLVTSDDGVVELAHESLARAWPRLRDWLDDDVEGQRILRHLATAADAWQAMQRPDSELYRGARLTKALEWRDDAAPKLAPVEQEFLESSRQLAEAEQRSSEDLARHQLRVNRRLRALLAACLALLVTAAAGGVFAVVQRGEARDAAEEALAAEAAQVAQRLGAQALVEEDFDLSLLLARQAVALDDTPQTRGYLLAALLRAPSAVEIMHVADDALLGDVALSPDGTTLAVADFFNKVVFFDARTHEPAGDPIGTATWIDSVAYSPDGRTLAYGGGEFQGGYVRLVDARTHELLVNVPVGGRPARLAFAGDGSTLVVMSLPHGGEPVITLRDAATLEVVAPPIEPNGFRGSFISAYYRPPFFSLTPDGRSLLTASDAGQLAMWDVPDGTLARSFPIPAGFHALAISPDATTVAIGVAQGIQLLDLRTGGLRAGTSLPGEPAALAFSPDGRTVVSMHLDGTVILWDAASATPRESLRGHSDTVTQAVFSPDGRTLYTVSFDGTAIAWDLTGTRTVQQSFTFTHDRDFDEAYDGHPGRFSPDGRLIAVGLKDSGVALLRADDLTPSGPPLTGTGGEVKALAFADDGRRLAALTGDGVLTIWDLETRTRLLPLLEVSGGYLVGVSFTPDGSAVATTGWYGGRLWDAATGRNLGDFATGVSASDVAFSRDGRYVAVARVLSGGGAGVWDLESRSWVANTEADPEADELSVALSPDGGLVAVGGYGRFVRIVDLETGERVHELDRGESSSTALEFGPDGGTLAVGGSLWDVETGTRIGPVLSSKERAEMMDLSPDGTRLLVTTGAGRGVVWDVDPGSWAERACALANRTLTHDEWVRFLPGRPYAPACAG